MSFTTEDLQNLLTTPVALFMLMLFGSFLSVLKQLRDARANGSSIGVGQYLLKLETLIMLGGNIIAFVGLVMTDTLNWTGAIAIGYVANSVADLKPGGRSAAVIDQIKE